MKKLVMLVAAVMLGLGTLTSCGGRKSEMEEAAKPLVSSIINDYTYYNSTSAEMSYVDCLRVKITEKVDDTHYKAIATLDNGNDIRIMIEDCGDKVQVTIPEQSGF